MELTLTIVDSLLIMWEDWLVYPRKVRQYLVNSEAGNLMDSEFILLASATYSVQFSPTN